MQPQFKFPLILNGPHTGCSHNS